MTQGRMFTSAFLPPTRAVLALGAALLMATIGTGCTVPLGENAPGPFDLRYWFIGSGFPEQPGFGRYVYVLLAPPDQNGARNKAVISAIVGALKPKIAKGPPSNQIALFEFPVVDSFRDAASDLAEPGLLTHPDQAAAIVDQYYDYDAAQSLLVAFHRSGDPSTANRCKGPGRGPYILVSGTPVASGTFPSGKYACFDLSLFVDGALPYVFNQMEYSVREGDIQQFGPAKATILAFVNASMLGSMFFDGVPHMVDEFATLFKF